MTPRGSSARPEVLRARKSTIASVAVPFSLLSRSSSIMALSPKGVAAFPSPRRLEVMFRIMALMAG